MRKITLSLFILSVLFSACKRKKGCTDALATNFDIEAKKDDGSCEYKKALTVPDTYNFENVSYSGQTTRLQLLNALVGAIDNASNSNHVTEQELIDLFENTNGLFSSTKDLASKTYTADKQLFYDWFSLLDSISSTGTGQEIDGRYYTADGIEIKQMVEKGLMGAVFYFQATSFYLENLASDDNTSVTDGKGTDMEHHFDEAFGYFGIPIDFSTNDAVKGDFTTSSWYWGKYCIDRNDQLNNRDSIFKAFRTGRAAISAQENDTRDTQVSKIRTEWELLVAANVVHYINSVKADITASNTGDKYHHWSEGKAFLMCLKYNVAKKISDSQWTNIDNAFGEKPDAVQSTSDFDSALQTLQDIYGFTNSQMLNL